MMISDFPLPPLLFVRSGSFVLFYVIGEKEEARSLFEEMLHNSNHLGLFSEDIDFETKEQLGEFSSSIFPFGTSQYRYIVFGRGHTTVF